MDAQSILARMKEPETITPREAKDFYIYLSYEWGVLHDRLGSAMADRAILIVSDLERNKLSVRQAEVFADASEAGQEVIKCKTKIKGLEEAIRSLKRAQSYFEMEAKNQY